MGDRNAMLDGRMQGNAMMWDVPQQQRHWYGQPGSPWPIVLSAADKAAGVLAQPVIGAYNGWREAMGYSQDPNAAPGYVTTDSIRKTGMDMAEGAVMGSAFSRAPAAALRSGVARPDAPPAALDMSQDARRAGAARNSNVKPADIAEEARKAHLAELKRNGPTRSYDKIRGEALRRENARDMGFDPDATHYRGMHGGEYNPVTAETHAQWFTDRPEVANSYVETGYLPDSIRPPSVIPAHIRDGKVFEMDALGHRYDELPDSALTGDFKDVDLASDDVVKRARELGYDTVRFKNMVDQADMADAPLPSTVTAVINPTHIRSKFAAFDPAKINDPNLMSANPITGLGASAMFNRREQKSPNMMLQRGLY